LINGIDNCGDYSLYLLEYVLSAVLTIILDPTSTWVGTITFTPLLRIAGLLEDDAV
jgi:hypothetical protein